MFTKDHVDVLKWFQKTYPDMVRALKDSSHHFDSDNLNPYHLENDCWSHTMMVFKVAEALSAANHHVKWSALLHDIGKPASREEIPARKKVRFLGHTGLSAFMAIDVLNKAGVDDKDALTIFQLIAVHDKLFDYVKVGEEVREKEIRETFKYESELLAHLLEQTRADSLGRFYELGDFDSREYMRNITNHFAPILQKMQEDAETENAAGNGQENKPSLTMLIGPPCSGKSTAISSMLKEIEEQTIIEVAEKFLNSKRATLTD